MNQVSKITVTFVLFFFIIRPLDCNTTTLHLFLLRKDATLKLSNLRETNKGVIIVPTPEANNKELLSLGQKEAETRTWNFKRPWSEEGLLRAILGSSRGKKPKLRKEV